MLKKARAFTALIAFVTAVRCEISIYRTSDQQEMEREFRDAPSLFGGTIPSDGIQVIEHLKLFNIIQMYYDVYLNYKYY